MSSTVQVFNKYTYPVSLPWPLKGVLAGGRAVNLIGVTREDVIEWLGGEEDMVQRSLSVLYVADPAVQPGDEDLLAMPVFTRKTTDATPTVLWSKTIDAGAYYSFRFLIKGRRTDAADRGTWRKEIEVYREVGGAATAQGNVFVPDGDQNANAVWTAGLSLVGNVLTLTVTGAVGETIRWVVEAVDVRERS